MPHLVIKINLDDSPEMTYLTLAGLISQAFNTYHYAVAHKQPITVEDAGVITGGDKELGSWDVYDVPVRVVHPDEVDELNDSEIATILHGLRMIQEVANGTGTCYAGTCDHFDDADQLTDEQIDGLCERVNLDGALISTEVR